jgi:DNA (cytosine-5)-methyltransferase 1
MSAGRRNSLSVVGLFAGIGGIELGLNESGHRTTLLCDVDSAAQAVLVERFPGVPLVGNVDQLINLPRTDIVAAGFPCQDLSQAGRTAGIAGSQSSVVSEVFRLLRRSRPTWLLLENVPFMLQLERGEAMRYLTASLEDLGFRWAYRVLDARAFGLPQRRRRVLLLASRDEDPREILFHGDEGEPEEETPWQDYACGFYWTEGTRGLGWTVDAIPTLKGGSTIGIPSPPAIRFPDGLVGLPDIRDAERLQGFQADWTRPAEAEHRRGSRWKLVGNAVSVALARWVGERLLDPQSYNHESDPELPRHGSWPTAAWGEAGIARRAALTPWPLRTRSPHLTDFLRYPPQPISRRATEGFLRRARASSLHFRPGFLEDVEAHLRTVEDRAVAA